MSQVHKYVTANARDEWSDEYDSYDEAVASATRMTHLGEPRAVLELTYTFDDSELVWTPDGSDFWPPNEMQVIEDAPRGLG